MEVGKLNLSISKKLNGNMPIQIKLWQGSGLGQVLPMRLCSGRMGSRGQWPRMSVDGKVVCFIRVREMKARGRRRAEVTD